jgi:hypothetical protein
MKRALTLTGFTAATAALLFIAPGVVFSVVRHLTSNLFEIALVAFGALLAVVVMSIKGHPSIAYPDFPSEFVPAARVPDTEDVTQAEADDTEAAA